jgi:hypothetical protein
MNTKETPTHFSETTVKDGKVYFDGFVAVLYSRGFGAGWSTWNKDVDCLFTPAIVEQVMQGEVTQEFAKSCYSDAPYFYAGGNDGLSIAWVKVGTKFRITEYDGAEGIETLDQTDWKTA